MNIKYKTKGMPFLSVKSLQLAKEDLKAVPGYSMPA
jgi:hypothetical protein